MQLAVVEACANIIEHAYGGRFDQPIALEAAANDGQLTLTIRDNGQPFDVQTYQAPTMDDGYDCGYGIYLMQQTMDSISFGRSVMGETVLTMVKFRTGSPACMSAQGVGVLEL